MYGIYIKLEYFLEKLTGLAGPVSTQLYDNLLYTFNGYKSNKEQYINDLNNSKTSFITYHSSALVSVNVVDNDEVKNELNTKLVEVNTKLDEVNNDLDLNGLITSIATELNTINDNKLDVGIGTPQYSNYTDYRVVYQEAPEVGGSFWKDQSYWDAAGNPKHTLRHYSQRSWYSKSIIFAVKLDEVTSTGTSGYPTDNAVVPFITWGKRNDPGSSWEIGLSGLSGSLHTLPNYVNFNGGKSRSTNSDKNDSTNETTKQLEKDKWYYIALVETHNNNNVEKQANFKCYVTDSYHFDTPIWNTDLYAKVVSLDLISGTLKMYIGKSPYRPDVGLLQGEIKHVGYYMRHFTEAELNNLIQPVDPNFGNELYSIVISSYNLYFSNYNHAKTNLVTLLGKELDLTNMNIQSFDNRLSYNETKKESILQISNIEVSIKLANFHKSIFYKYYELAYNLNTTYQVGLYSKKTDIDSKDNLELDAQKSTIETLFGQIESKLTENEKKAGIAERDYDNAIKALSFYTEHYESLKLNWIAYQTLFGRLQSPFSDNEAEWTNTYHNDQTEFNEQMPDEYNQQLNIHSGNITTFEHYKDIAVGTNTNTLALDEGSAYVSTAISFDNTIVDSIRSKLEDIKIYIDNYTLAKNIYNDLIVKLLSLLSDIEAQLESKDSVDWSAIHAYYDNAYYDLRVDTKIGNIERYSSNAKATYTINDNRKEILDANLETLNFTSNQIEEILSRIQSYFETFGNVTTYRDTTLAFYTRVHNRVNLLNENLASWSSFFDDSKEDLGLWSVFYNSTIEDTTDHIAYAIHTVDQYNSYPFDPSTVDQYNYTVDQLKKIVIDEEDYSHAKYISVDLDDDTATATATLYTTLYTSDSSDISSIILPKDQSIVYVLEQPPSIMSKKIRLRNFIDNAIDRLHSNDAYIYLTLQHFDYTNNKFGSESDQKYEDQKYELKIYKIDVTLTNEQYPLVIDRYFSTYIKDVESVINIDNFAMLPLVPNYKISYQSSVLVSNYNENILFKPNGDYLNPLLPSNEIYFVTKSYDFGTNPNTLNVYWRVDEGVQVNVIEHYKPITDEFYTTDSLEVTLVVANIALWIDDIAPTFFIGHRKRYNMPYVMFESQGEKFVISHEVHLDTSANIPTQYKDKGFLAIRVKFGVETGYLKMQYDNQDRVIYDYDGYGWENMSKLFAWKLVTEDEGTTFKILNWKYEVLSFFKFYDDKRVSLIVSNTQSEWLYFNNLFGMPSPEQSKSPLYSLIHTNNGTSSPLPYPRQSPTDATIITELSNNLFTHSYQIYRDSTIDYLEIIPYSVFGDLYNNNIIVDYDYDYDNDNDYDHNREKDQEVDFSQVKLYYIDHTLYVHWVGYLHKDITFSIIDISQPDDGPYIHTSRAYEYESNDINIIEIDDENKMYNNKYRILVKIPGDTYFTLGNIIRLELQGEEVYREIDEIDVTQLDITGGETFFSLTFDKSEFISTDGGTLKLCWKSKYLKSNYNILDARDQQITVDEILTGVFRHKEEAFYFEHEIKNVKSYITPLRLTVNYLEREELIDIGYNILGSLLNIELRYKPIKTSQTDQSYIYAYDESLTYVSSVDLVTIEINKPIEDLDTPTVIESQLHVFQEDGLNKVKVPNLLINDKYYFRFNSQDEGFVYVYDATLTFNETVIKVEPLHIIDDKSKYLIDIINPLDGVFSEYEYTYVNSDTVPETFVLFTGSINNVTFETEYLTIEQSYDLKNLIERHIPNPNNTIDKVSVDIAVENHLYNVSDIELELELVSYDDFMIRIYWNSYIGGNYELHINDDMISSSNLVTNPEFNADYLPALNSSFTLHTFESPARIVVASGTTITLEKYTTYNPLYNPLYLQPTDIYSNLSVKWRLTFLSAQNHQSMVQVSEIYPTSRYFNKEPVSIEVMPESAYVLDLTAEERRRYNNIMDRNLNRELDDEIIFGLNEYIIFVFNVPVEIDEIMWATYDDSSRAPGTIRLEYWYGNVWEHHKDVTISPYSLSTYPHQVLHTLLLNSVQYLLLKEQNTDNYLRHHGNNIILESYQRNIGTDFWWKFDKYGTILSYHNDGTSYLGYSDDNVLWLIQSDNINNRKGRFNLNNNSYFQHTLVFGIKNSDDVQKFQLEGIQDMQLSIKKRIVGNYNSAISNTLALSVYDPSNQESNVEIVKIFAENDFVTFRIKQVIAFDINDMAYNLYQNDVLISKFVLYDIPNTTINDFDVQETALSINLNDVFYIKMVNILDIEAKASKTHVYTIVPVTNTGVKRDPNNQSNYTFFWNSDIHLDHFDIYYEDHILPKVSVDNASNTTTFEYSVLIQEADAENMYGSWRIEKRDTFLNVLPNAGVITIKRPDTPKEISITRYNDGHKLSFVPDKYFSSFKKKGPPRLNNLLLTDYVNGHAISEKNQIDSERKAYIGISNDTYSNVEVTIIPTGYINGNTIYFEQYGFVAIALSSDTSICLQHSVVDNEIMFRPFETTESFSWKLISGDHGRTFKIMNMWRLVDFNEVWYIGKTSSTNNLTLTNIPQDCIKWKSDYDITKVHEQTLTYNNDDQNEVLDYTNIDYVTVRAPYRIYLYDTLDYPKIKHIEEFYTAEYEFKGQHGTEIEIEEISYLNHVSVSLLSKEIMERPDPFTRFWVEFNGESFIFKWM